MTKYLECKMLHRSQPISWEGRTPSVERIEKITHYIVKQQYRESPSTRKDEEQYQ